MCMSRMYMHNILLSIANIKYDQLFHYLRIKTCENNIKYENLKEKKRLFEQNRKKVI